MMRDTSAALAATAEVLAPRGERRVMYPLCPFVEDSGDVRCNKPATRQDGLCAKHSGYRLTTVEIKAKAKEKMERRATTYADIHLAAARKAAEDGDSRPAEWALLHTKTVEPVAKEQNVGNGLTVQIGVVLPGLLPTGDK